jgi:hypothetical protein
MKFSKNELTDSQQKLVNSPEMGPNVNLFGSLVTCLTRRANKKPDQTYQPTMGEGKKEGN